MPTPSPRSSRFRRLCRSLLPAAARALLALPLAATLLRAQAAPPPAVPATTLPPAAPPAAGPTTAGPAAKVSPDTVIFSVGDEKVTAREFDLFIETLGPDDQQMARGAGRRAWAESFANMKLLAREASKRKLDQTQENQLRLSIVREQVLANAMVVGLQETMDEALVKKYFDDHREDLERVSARHILIRTNDSKMPPRPGVKELTDAEAKAKAEQLIARIKAGEDFGKIAAKESDDVGSAQDGGDVGSFTRKRMVAPFSQAAFALKEGEVSGPVRSEFGYHIIQLTGRFDTYEKLSDMIRQILGPQRTNMLLRDLRGKTTVVLNDQVLGPAQPMPPIPDGAPGTVTPPAPPK